MPCYPAQMQQNLSVGRQASWASSAPAMPRLEKSRTHWCYGGGTSRGQSGWVLPTEM